MDEDKQKRYLREFNNLNYLLLSALALFGIAVIAAKLLGYSIDWFTPNIPRG